MQVVEYLKAAVKTLWGGKLSEATITEIVGSKKLKVNWLTHILISYIFQIILLCTFVCETGYLCACYDICVLNICVSRKKGCIIFFHGCQQMWKKYCEFKMSYYGAVALLYQGLQAEEQQKMGERVAYYQAAVDMLVEATKLAKNLDQHEVYKCCLFGEVEGCWSLG